MFRPFAVECFAVKFRLLQCRTLRTMFALVVSCILAGILGFAAHRASVCTVRAVAEMTHSRTGYMLASIGKSAMWVFAITIPVFLLVPQTASQISGWQLTYTAILGGLLFGIGSGINGACAYATMARMVDGEVGMMITVGGFVIGVFVFVVLVGSSLVQRPQPAPGLVPDFYGSHPLSAARSCCGQSTNCSGSGGRGLPARRCAIWCWRNNTGCRPRHC